MREITDKHVLGPLCQHDHAFENTNQSLRYKSTRQCVECSDIWRRENAPKYRKANAKRALKNYHQDRNAQLVRMAKYRKTSGFQQSAKKFRAANKESLLARTREWRKTPRGRLMVSLNNLQRRKIAKNAQRIPYNVSELEAQFALFDHLCAYCDSAATTVDHFVPLASNGIEGLCNLLPACRPCNTSKGAKNAYAWYSKQPFFLRSRWEKIHRILGISLNVI